MGGRHHALEWARALGARNNLPVLDILRVQKKPTSMRGLRKRERLRALSFGLARGLSISSCQLPPIVFVDDVYTTGATARAAWKSMGEPPDFSIFCFAERSPKDP